MPITDRQREQRRRHIGASDVPVLLGLSPYRTAYELWLEKTGQLMPSTETSEAAEIGNDFEPVMLRWGLRQLQAAHGPLRMRSNVRRVRGCMAANLDAVILDRPWALEAKTAGLANPFAPKTDWGRDGGWMVPSHIAAQAYAQMWVADLERVYIPALVIGRQGDASEYDDGEGTEKKLRRLYCIDRSERRVAESCEAVAAECAAWWQRHVIGGEPPPVGERAPDPRVLLYANPLDGSEVEMQPSDEWAAFMAAREARKAAAATLRTLEKAEDDAESRWMITMGKATRAIVGGHLCRIREVNRSGYTVEAKTYRQLEIKAIKEAAQ